LKLHPALPGIRNLGELPTMATNLNLSRSNSRGVASESQLLPMCCPR
jgi:hypothetical protein